MSALHDEDWIRPDGQGGIFIGTAHVQGADLQGVVDLMYRVAGLSPRITLPRFTVTADGESAPQWLVQARRGGVKVSCGQIVPPDEARTLAAVIAAYADLQEGR